MSTTVTHDAPSAAAKVPTWRLLYWSVQRELWEHRSLYVAPLAVAALILVGFTIGLVGLPATLRTAADAGGMRQRELVEQPYTLAALLLMGTTFVIGIFYCLDALYGERRDRSVLFWKSLPVSDVTTVLAKASVPIVILPLLTFAATFVTQSCMLLVASARLAGTGLSVWSQLSFGEMTWTLFHHLVLGHGLWYAPIWGWLLFCSAWARRTPVLWATLPLLAVGLIEKIAFGTATLGNWLGARVMGGPPDPASDHNAMTMGEITASSPVQLLTSSGLWIGLALTAVFLVLAVRLRHSRGPA